MSSVHYFQRTAQPENVATNNTLLLLSRLYQESPNKFKGFLNDLLDDNDLESGIQFNQQQRGNGSIPDGSICQVSFKAVVETKPHNNFSLEQLKEHLKSFGKEQHQVLLSLSPIQPADQLKLQIETEVSAFNNNNNTSIKYLPTTFQEIITKYRNSIEDYDNELIDVIDDFEGYCINDRLITDEVARMRVVTCGWTLQENRDYNIYFAPANRGYSEHTYLGFYKDKSVQGIGEIENIITANLPATQELQIISKTTKVTDKQKQNIINIIKAAKKNINWDIDTEYKFFCIKQFYPTSFRKKTKYPLQKSKFFNLKELLGLPTLPDTEEIAEQLKKLEW